MKLVIDDKELWVYQDTYTEPGLTYVRFSETGTSSLPDDNPIIMIYKGNYGHSHTFNHHLRKVCECILKGKR